MFYVSNITEFVIFYTQNISELDRLECKHCYFTQSAIIDVSPKIDLYSSNPLFA